MLFVKETNTSTLHHFACRENWLLQNFRAAEKMMRKSQQTQPGRERRGRVREDNPYTVVYMKQSHRALGHLCSLSIQLSLPLLSKPLGSAFNVFL